MSAPIPATHGAEAALFEHVLSCQAQCPANFSVESGPGRPAHAQSLLRAVAMIEDMGMHERQHEHEDLAPFNQRMEAKLDLNLLLLGRMLERTTPALPMRHVRWSLRGACLQYLENEASRPVPDTEGILSIQPCDWLPESLELPARVLAADTGHLWLRFPAFPPALSDALERHLFRQHRRQIARVRMESEAAA